MRILSIFNRYTQYGGEETVTRRIADLLGQAGYSETYLYSTRELLGNSIASRLAAPLKSLYNWQAATELRELQSRHSFDAWLVHNVFPGLSPAVFSTAFELGVPVIYMAHNYRLGCINGSFLRNGQHCELCLEHGRYEGIKHKCWHNSLLLSSYNTFYQSLMKRTGLFEKTAAFIGLSAPEASLLVKTGIPAEKITVIPHFVDFQEPLPPPTSRGDILFLGRLSKEKGVHLLLDSWRQLAPSDRKLVIAGTGPEENALKQYAEQHGLANVEFTGFAEQDKQRELWERASLFIMPSIWAETAAMTILEGWSFGRPALAYNIGAAVEYLQNPSFGWLADLGTPGSLTATLKEALDSDDNRLSDMSRSVIEQVRRNHSPQMWLEQFSALFHQITSQNS